MTHSVLFYAQHLLGIGHLQRSLRIAEALVDRGVAITLVSGGMPTELPCPAAIRFVQLPPIRARDARYELIDATGKPVDAAYREQRSRALLDIFGWLRPDAVVIEGFPLARRAFRFELDPLITAIRRCSPRPRLFCSVRDIVVVRDDPQRHRDIVERVRRDFEAVLVHGDPALIPLDVSLPAAPAIADQLLYTGYVGPPAPLTRPPAGASQVIVSAGGGAAGAALLSAASGACKAGCLADSQWLLLTGMNLPQEQFDDLRRTAPPNAAIERFRPDLAGLLQDCRVSVSQAGYNTVLDILAARARAVLVPFAAERETEQLTRAERLAALGVVQLVREQELSPRRLAAAIERAVSVQPRAISVDTDGARRAAQIIADAIASPDSAAQDLANTIEPSIIRQ